MRSAVGISPREQVSEVQRARILAAMVGVAGEQGVEAATVARVVGRAGVSRRTFYDLFEDRRDCFLAAFEDAVSLAAQRVVPVFEAEGRWVERVRAGLSALLVLFDERPELARVCVVQALAAGPETLKLRGELSRVLARIVDTGRGEPRRSGGQPPPLTAEGIVGGAFSVIHARLLEPDPGPLTDLLNPLMSMIVLPYQGPGVARRELARPVPRRAPRTHAQAPCQDGDNAPGHSHAGDDNGGGGARDPLRGLDMRLTYRTLRVLGAIAGQPGASNREIAERAGVHDQGQMSKLLGRLQRLALIENTGQGHAKGAPNAWSLTPTGTQIEQAIHLPPSAGG